MTKTLKFVVQLLNLSELTFNPRNGFLKILMLLDPHNLSVHQNLPFLDFPKMEIGNVNWQICNILSIFDVHTGYGGLKALEFYQESIYGVQSAQIKFRVLK